MRPKRAAPQMVLAPAAAQVVRVGIPTVVAAVAGVLICVEIKISRCVLNRRVDLHAIDATPARWRGDAGSSPFDGANAAASSPRNAPNTLVDFHTETNPGTCRGKSPR